MSSLNTLNILKKKKKLM